MATAVIGGLIASTVLSLVFVPSFYMVMDDAARFTGWLFGRFVGKTDEPKPVDLAAELREAHARISELEARDRTPVSTSGPLPIAAE
jgi:hypothetical protein